MKAAWAAILVAASVGCGRNPAPLPQNPPSTPGPAMATNQAPPKSSVSTVIDGLTGKTAVEAGKRARGQIQRIGNQERQDINEAMEP